MKYRSAVITVAIVLMIWMMAVITGMRLSYLRTNFSFVIRAYILFPVIFLSLVYFSYIYKGDNFKKTGYELRMSSITDKKVKIQETILGVCGLVLIAGCIAWSSIAFTAWVSQFLADAEYQHIYIIEGVSYEGGALWSGSLDLRLRDPQEKRTDSFLRINRSDYSELNWRVGESVCLVGYSSYFGVHIEKISRNLFLCDRKPKTGTY